MRKNTTLSTLVKISMLLLLASVSKISFGQACDPKWNRTKSSNCENSPIQFEANSPGRTTFEWDYGDGQSSGSGTTSAYRDPVHAYAKAGTYTVVFKGSGGAGPCSDTVMITIKESPVVKLKALYNSSQCFAGNKFCFVDSTKAATNSKILTLKYLFSDGALYTINDPKGGDTICHSVIDPNGGYFDLTIEAEDYNGCVTKIRYDKFIRVFPKIGVNFKSNAPNACIKSLATITNLTDTFTKLTDIARFTWNFGDPKDPQNIISGDSITNTQWWRGPSGNGVIQHTYDVSGRKSGTYVFNGSLTVTTKYGCTETFTFKGSATISILNVRIIAQDDSACSSDPEVKFTAVDAGSGDPITGVGSFLWNFGDPPSGPANFDKTTLIGAPHNYGLGPWMTSLNIKAGPCNITVFDTITKVGPTSSIERPFTRVPEDEKYQCIIKDSVHFTNVSTFYHTDPNPVFEDSSAVYRYYTLFSSRKVPYYQLPLTEDTIGPYATYRGVATTITRFYLENDTLETFPQSALTADSIIFYVKGKKVKRAVSNPIISGQDTMVIKKQKEYAFKWPGDQTAINSVFAPPTQRHKDHVLRLWTFGDNYAPKCTTDTRRNKNVGLNCNFSLDSLPVHWYTPWDQIYKYYNGGQFFSTPAEKTVLCKGGRFCYKVRYYPRDSFEIPADTLVILPYGASYSYGPRNISSTDPEKMDSSFRIKRVRDIKGPGYYTATLSDEEWTFNVQGPIGVKNITTGVTYQLSSGKHKLKIGDQFELYKGDDAKLAAQVVITAGKKIKAVPTTICIDTIIGGRDTFIQRSRTFIDSSFHRTNFFTKSAQCNTVALYHEDTIHALRCKSISQISLALLPPNAKGLEFKGVRCYAPPSPPYGMEFDVGKTKPGCTQRLLKFNFDSASGKNNWVSHGGFLAPPLPGSAPWHLGYQLSGAYPTKFVKPYGAGEINNRNPGWVTVGVVIGNGRWLDKTGPLDSIECIDTFWYHNAFRYLYLDSRFTVISPEKDKKTVCVGDTITFQLFDPLMDSITSLVWNWNDDEGSYYEERFFYYKPYKGPNNNRNDKTITDWKPSDKWLYNYVIRLEYDGFSYKTIDTLVTAVIRKWSIGVDISRAGDALKRAFEGLGLNMNEIPSADIPFYFGNGTGFGCIDTTGLGSLISFGVTPYRDALTFSRHRPDQVLMKGKNGSDSIYMENWYRYTDYTRKDSTIISESFHWRAKSMAGFDTLKQVNPNRYSQLRVTPGVFRHVYKKANRYFPTFQLRNTEGCFGPRNKEVDVGFFWNWTYSDTVICHGTDVVLRDSIRYFAYEDPFVWLDPKAYWMDPNRFVKLREWKKIDFNEHNDTLTSQKFDVTGLGIPPFRWHYDDPGVYNIRIAMKDSVGCMDTAKQKVYVTGVKAGFKALNAGGLSCKNILSFSDTSKVIDPCMITKGIKCDEIVEWTWDFGDGKRKSKLTNPSHDYTQNGTFTVRLKVRTRLGCEDSASLMITINGPRPYFNPISDTIVCVGDSVIFENLSYEPLFSPTWEWNFGDGKVASANTKTSVGHRYNAPGTYKVYLTQFDVINGTSIRCSAIYPDTSSELVTKIERIVKVKPVAPSDFDIAPNDTVCPNELVSFTSQSDTLYKRFSWRFGDGDTVNTNNPTASHAYSKTGSFKVIMIPDYDTPEFHKCLDTVKKDVVVVDVKADFDITPDDAPKFCFTNTSVGAVSYEWVFQDPRGDGSSTETDPCYTWQDTGCFNVTLFATNAIGCVDSITKQVCYKFVSKIIPYNVFTPEPADGINDVFRVNAEGLDKFDIIIYNRWGEVVFESKDQFFQWNGKVKNKGAECPEGTYFYIMNYKIKNKELNDGQKKPISGTVTLIRGKK